jgi:hypothetical protein
MTAKSQKYIFIFISATQCTVGCASDDAWRVGAREYGNVMEHRNLPHNIMNKTEKNLIEFPID